MKVVKMAKPMQTQTSTFDKVKIETVPNNVLQTSFETLDEGGNKLINK